MPASLHGIEPPPITARLTSQYSMVVSHDDYRAPVRPFQVDIDVGDTYQPLLRGSTRRRRPRRRHDPAACPAHPRTIISVAWKGNDDGNPSPLGTRLAGEDLTIFALPCTAFDTGYRQIGSR